MKSKSFFIHYNKISSRIAKRPQISVHHTKKCHIVDNVVVKVPTQGRIRKSQPYFVMTGKCVSLEIIDGIAYIS